MIRRHKCRGLPEGGLGDRCSVAVRRQIEPAFIVVQLTGKLFSEEQLLRGLCQLHRSESEPDRRE